MADYSSIIDLVPTKQSAVDFIERLETLSDSVFNTKTSLEAKMGKIFSLEEKNKLLGLFDQNGLNAANPVQVQKFINGLKIYLEKLPVISLHISYKPKEETVKNILEWITANNKQGALINFVFNKELIGGAAIEFNGLYKDYSLKTRFSQIKS